MKHLISSLHPLERKIVQYLKDGLSFEGLIEESGLKDVEVMRALQWLSNKDVLDIKEEIEENIILEENGATYKNSGLPEKRFLALVKEKKLSIDELKNSNALTPDEVNVCLGLLKSKGAIEFDSEKKIKITNNGKEILLNDTKEDIFLKNDFPIKKEDLKKDEKEVLAGFLKRKGIIKVEIKKKKTIHLKKLGHDLLKEDISKIEVIDKITTQVLKEKTWKGKEFRPYDVKINVPKIDYGKRHFVNQAILYMKRIWLDLGFVEMSGGFVQTSFKDLDCLFVPQDHPARAMQDTFYIKDPKTGKLPSWYKKVKDVHENGGDTGSTGWGGVWSKEIAEENLLRTHTTVLSAEYLRKIHDKEFSLPIKFFSVNKVFRNEALDWKHLFEFNQVEGIVIDRNANVSHLKGYLREFFGKMGFTDIRMRPAHFPYTEPSFEVDVYDPKRKTWVELGGAGIFRPEVTKTLIGEEIPVLAWGLGMERIIVAYFELTDLRDLYRNDLKQLKRMKAWMKV